MPITIKTNGMAFKDADGTYKQFDAIKGDSFPSGGTTGQVLTKRSNADSDVEWKNAGVSKVELIDIIYPIGSIYMSVNAVDPTVLFGGIWESIEEKFLLGAGSNYSLGSTGGETEHTLTVSEIPPHTHTYNRPNLQSGETMDTTKYYQGLTISSGISTGSTGGGTAHNNMPPYLTVNIWKRVG